MKINALTDGFYKGLGDMCCMAWFGRGHTFFSDGWRADVLRMFMMDVTGDRTDSVIATEPHDMAIHRGLPYNYAEWIAHQMGIDTPLERPLLNIPQMQRETGRQWGRRVLVFPKCEWAIRSWPKNYWMELCMMFTRIGLDFVVVYPQRDSAFTVYPDIYGREIGEVAAACQQAKLVISADSGPAHLAGTLGTKTLVIGGPTGARRFAHIPEVRVLNKSSIGCSPCYFGPACHPTCDAGCLELYRTFPEEVFDIAMQMLGEKPEGGNLKPETGNLKPEGAKRGASTQVSGFKSQVSKRKK